MSDSADVILDRFAKDLDKRLEPLWPRVAKDGRFRLKADDAIWREITICLKQSQEAIEQALSEAGKAMSEAICARCDDPDKLLLFAIPNVGGAVGIEQVTARTEHGFTTRATTYRDGDGTPYVTMDMMFWELPSA